VTTKAERQWMDAITQLGCICCHLDGHPGTPAVVHHILRNGRRIDHLHTIPLCDPGHHQNPPKGSGKIARHPTKARFTKRYGTEGALLAVTQRLVRSST
jgi:hypothetical protein